jgi:hypothetical protein
MDKLKLGYGAAAALLFVALSALVIQSVTMFYVLVASTALVLGIAIYIGFTPLNAATPVKHRLRKAKRNAK